MDMKSALKTVMVVAAASLVVRLALIYYPTQTQQYF